MILVIKKVVQMQLYFVDVLRRPPYVTATARIVRGAGSMKRSGVHPSVCLSHRSTAAASARGFAHGSMQQARAMSCGEPRASAEHRLVSIRWDYATRENYYTRSTATVRTNLTQFTSTDDERFYHVQKVFL